MIAKRWFLRTDESLEKLTDSQSERVPNGQLVLPISQAKGQRSFAHPILRMHCAVLFAFEQASLACFFVCLRDTCKCSLGERIYE